MKQLLAVIAALWVCSLAAELDVGKETVPIDGKLEDLLNIRQFNIHRVRDGDESDDGSPELIVNHNTITDGINVGLEALRETIINGSEDREPLDPHLIPQVGPMLIQSSGVDASMELRDVSIEGLRWFVADETTFNALRLTLGLHLTIPHLLITGDFEGEARLLLIKPTTKGDFRIFINRIELGCEMRIGVSLLGGNLFLRELNIKVDVHDTQVYFEGLIGNGWVNVIFNSIIQNISQEALQSELDNINNTINETLFEVIDNFLRQFTFDDLTGN